MWNYLQLVAADAWKRWKASIHWWEPVGTALISLALRARYQSFDEVSKNVVELFLFGAVPAVLWSAFRLILYVLVTPSRLHSLQVQEIGRLSARVEDLESRATTASQHRHIADVLTDYHAKGIETLMHVQLSSDPQFKQWQEREGKFTQELLAEMSLLGCTKQEIHSVEKFGGWPLENFHKNYQYNNAMSLLKFRLDRLAEVATSRVKKAEEQGG